MGIRDQQLDVIAPVLATFSIHQTAGVDDLKDINLGEPVKLTGNNEIGPITDSAILLGKLVDLSLTDADNGARVATVQIGGICRLKIAATFPVVGNRVVGAAGGAVKQAPALATNDPVGGNIGRGNVLAVNGATDCVILLN